MTYLIDLQKVCDDALPVSEKTLISWSEAVLINQKLDAAELTLRLVNTEEMTQLNYQYRQKNQATNVLAFPSHIPRHIELELPLLGDVIICPAVLKQESLQAAKPLDAHWAHIVIHGILHLLGFSHELEKESNIMQALEIQLLARFDFPNPYNYLEGYTIE